MKIFDEWFEKYADANLDCTETVMDDFRGVAGDSYRAGLKAAADLLEEYDSEGACEEAWKRIQMAASRAWPMVSMGDD
jgi:hypothetical protein